MKDDLTLLGGNVFKSVCMHVGNFFFFFFKSETNFQVDWEKNTNRTEHDAEQPILKSKKSNKT